MSDPLEQEYDDFRPRRTRRARILLFVAVGIVLAFFLVTLFASLYTDRLWYASVGYTGEIQGVNAVCEYKGEEPIQVKMRIGFSLGRGPQATADKKTYRYWVAVTARNQQVLAKEWFDLPVDFKGQDRVNVEDKVEGIVIPRAKASVSGTNFEVLVGFEVTPEMAEFNREGKRFRINAGVSDPSPGGQ